MKIVLVLMSVAIYGNVEAQTFSEWFQQKKTQIAYYTEQVAALKAYNLLLVKGYNVVRDGLQVVSDIRNSDFNLHNAYFTSLKEMNGAFQTDAIDIYDNVIRQCKNAETLSAYFPTEQRSYVLSVADNLEEKARKELCQYELVTASGNYELSDEDRLARITQCLNQLHDQYDFAKNLCQNLKVMLMQTSKETADVKGTHQIYMP